MLAGDRARFLDETACVRYGKGMRMTYDEIVNAYRVEKVRVNNALAPMRPQIFDHRMKGFGINAGLGSKRPLAQKPCAVTLRHRRAPRTLSNLESHHN